MHIKSSACPRLMQSLLEQRGLVIVVADTPTCMLEKAPRWNVGLLQRSLTQKPLREESTWGRSIGVTEQTRFFRRTRS